MDQGVKLRKRQFLITPGRPIEVVDVPDDAAEDQPPQSQNISAGRIGPALKAYKAALDQLVSKKYQYLGNVLPAYLTQPCIIYVIQCADAVLVRYECSPDEKTLVRYGSLDKSIVEVCPMFSELFIHIAEPSQFVPTNQLPNVKLTKNNQNGELVEEILTAYHVLLVPPASLQSGAAASQPPSRPPLIASLANEIDVLIEGEVISANSEVNGARDDKEQFVAHSRIRLPVGWEYIELYPILDDSYWNPDHVGIWAELDLLSTAAQRNLIPDKLKAIDGRAQARQKYALLLAEFESLLNGLEEPVHQFLKKNPELLSPTWDRVWSKLPFGERVCDFVIRETDNDYQLVELEAPIRELFRKDGQQREELTHAINQIMDWVQYIADNKTKLEEKYELTGISVTPRMLVVIGRSTMLTDENRKKLATLQNAQPKLRILTYDDVLVNARTNLERILGPITVPSQNAQLYFFKPADHSGAT